MSSRTFVDAQGTEWEVYGETDDDARVSLDWDHLPQEGPSGLVFISNADLRRLFPAPPDWQRLSDVELSDCCNRALSLH